MFEPSSPSLSPAASFETNEEQLQPHPGTYSPAQRASRNAKGSFHLEGTPKLHFSSRQLLLGLKSLGILSVLDNLDFLEFLPSSEKLHVPCKIVGILVNCAVQALFTFRFVKGRHARPKARFLSLGEKN